MNNLQAFQQFMNQMKGRNPNQIIQQLVQGGKLTQGQLNQIQQQAKQIESDFEGVKKMFGFK